MKENEVNPQREDGHVEINNLTSERFAKTHLSGNEWQILWVVLRKTWGFNKKEDYISLTQFQKFTGLSRDSVNDAVDRLVGKNLLVVDKSGFINKFSFNKHHNQWKLVGKKGLVGFSPSTSREIPNQLVGKKGHTINIYTKDNIQKTLVIFLEKFNSLFNSSYRVTTGRTKSLSFRLKTYKEEEILQAVENMSLDSFYQGKNDRGWKADPDFLLRSDEQIDRWLNKRKRTQEEELELEAKKIGFTIK